MRILTLGESPMLLTSGGRLHADLIRSLSQEGYQVEAFVQNHDVSYFRAGEDGCHYFESTPLHPYLGQRGGEAVALAATIRRFLPNAVITTGDYASTAYVGSLKIQQPEAFRWIAFLSSGSTVINERYLERIAQAEAIFCTTLMFTEELTSKGLSVEHVRYGPSEAFVRLGERPSSVNVLCSARNFASSNLGAFLRCATESKEVSYLHSNLDDVGDLDVPLLLRRLRPKNFAHTASFCSIREGVPEEEMNAIYNRHHLIVDCSMQSGTALSMLEAMSTGCVPIGPNFGAVGDVISLLPKEFQLFTPHEPLLGVGQEEHAIVSPSGLTRTVHLAADKTRADCRWWEEASLAAQRVVGRFFSKERCLGRVKETLANVLFSEHAVVVDTY